MPRFLSREWCDAHSQLRAEFAGRLAPPEVSCRVNLVVSDVPDLDGVVEVMVETSPHGVCLDLGAFPDPGMTVSLDAETARALLVEENQQIVMQAIMGGKIHMRGDSSLVAAFRPPMPDEHSVAFGVRLREITD